jgi:hypothetical protein
MRKLKTIGSALVVVFALTAVMASAAQASEFEWGSGATNIARMSNAVQKFNVPGTGSFECNEVEAEASVTGTKAASVTTKAGSLKYHNSGSTNTCPASLGTATVTTHNCEYQFVAGTTTGTGKSTGTVNIVNCPTTSPIEVSVSGLCLIKISNQTGVGPVKYSTIGTFPTGEVQIAPEAKNIAYTKSGLCGSGSGTNAEYSGTVNVTGRNGTTSVGARVIP